MLWCFIVGLFCGWWRVVCYASCLCCGWVLLLWLFVGVVTVGFGWFSCLDVWCLLLFCWFTVDGLVFFICGFVRLVCFCLDIFDLRVFDWCLIWLFGLIDCLIWELLVVVVFWLGFCFGGWFEFCFVMGVCFVMCLICMVGLFELFLWFWVLIFVFCVWICCWLLIVFCWLLFVIVFCLFGLCWVLFVGG